MFTKGTPQGGILSPVLANIYLHYVLDRWIETEVKGKAKGFVEMVRYADDFVICVQYQREAEAILESLKKRFAVYGLELAEDKTRIIEFGRFARQRAKKGEDDRTRSGFLASHIIATSVRRGIQNRQENGREETEECTKGTESMASGSPVYGSGGMVGTSVLQDDRALSVLRSKRELSQYWNILLLLKIDDIQMAEP